MTVITATAALVAASQCSVMPNGCRPAMSTPVRRSGPWPSTWST
jgi:hypothetical protein